MLDRPFTRGMRREPEDLICIPVAEYHALRDRRLGLHPFWWWLSGWLMGAFIATFGRW